MPLLPNARELVRKNLEAVKDRKRVKAVPIGTLTARQLEDINTNRIAEALPPIIDEVVFVGGHIYKRRIVGDGYTIEDVLDQISAAMDSASIVIRSLKMTAMENPNFRPDGYGNHVRDRAVFECSARHPRPELYSVMPKGDRNKPHK